MKKLFVFLFLSFIGIISIVGFSKDSTDDILANEKHTSISGAETFNKDIVIVRCDLYRPKFDCINGRGLCNCEWFPNANKSEELNSAGINLKFNSKNNTMLLVSKDFNKLDSKPFHIDEDIVIPESTANELGHESIVIKSGVYNLSNFEGNKALKTSVEVK